MTAATVSLEMVSTACASGCGSHTLPFVVVTDGHTFLVTGVHSTSLSRQCILGSPHTCSRFYSL